ncbi:phosphoribosylformylglycinamidine synthase [Psychroflexus sp. CAK57W]|uniref:HAEPLYID family protein n=1 Tax=Psychroflexus curvus TaxID=2873595 RepID=UPI001CCAB737|nr:HAEPLYID family protein [Psychroflexus curvus]MBZ9786513.1 phosphoribosylformylglycinamidine synthase [Psychroflexus curvus]
MSTLISLRIALFSIFIICSISVFSQITKQEKDSIYIAETEEQENLSAKVLHAEPLYIDLIRDLGARKGEREWNLGFGIKDNNNYEEYETLIEYEWAVIDRLGLEVELPFTFYYDRRGVSNGENSLPRSKLEGLQLAAQYTFLVDPKHNLSMAGGYLHKFTMNAFDNYSSSRLFTGNLISPFLVVAKRFGTNFHSLLYTGPVWERGFSGFENEFFYQINSSFHYMITGTRNFIGLEINKIVLDGNLETTLRPQMRLGISEHLMIGIVTGIPIEANNDRFSTFFRLIYEPKTKH